MDRNSPEFKKLKAKWYKKLENTGFKDIEQPDGNLKTWAGNYFITKYNKISCEAKEAYYNIAGAFLQHHKFKNRTEKFIWEQHSQGVSITNIAKILRSKRKIAVGRGTIHQIIKTLAAEALKLCLNES